MTLELCATYRAFYLILINVSKHLFSKPALSACGRRKAGARSEIAVGRTSLIDLVVRSHKYAAPDDVGDGHNIQGSCTSPVLACQNSQTMMHATKGTTYHHRSHRSVPFAAAYLHRGT